MYRLLTVVVPFTCLLLAGARFAAAQDNRTKQLLSLGEKALESREEDTALRIANEALAAAPKNLEVLTFRARVYGAKKDYAAALADLDQVLNLAPKWVAAYDVRGKYRFMAGDFAGSVADFDKYLELRPEAADAHWQRGISLYFAGEYAKGSDQFIAYQKVNDADVENSVWQYLCNAKVVGKEQALQEFPVTGLDRRIPLMKVYELFTGKATVDDVIKTAQSPGVQRDEAIRRAFYMNLYVGLYYISEDQPDQALEYLRNAANPIHEFNEYSYMWHVARVYTKLLEDKQTAKEKAPAEAPSQ